MIELKHTPTILDDYVHVSFVHSNVFEHERSLVIVHDLLLTKTGIALDEKVDALLPTIFLACYGLSCPNDPDCVGS